MKKHLLFTLFVLLLLVTVGCTYSENSNNVEEKEEVAGNSITYTEIKGCYEWKNAETENESAGAFYLALKEDGTYSYTEGVHAPRGSIGNYVIKDNSIILNELFATGSDVSLVALKKSELILTVNPDGSITDSSNFVLKHNNGSGITSITLKKTSDTDPVLNINQEIRTNAVLGSIFAEDEEELNLGGYN